MPYLIDSSLQENTFHQCINAQVLPLASQEIQSLINSEKLSKLSLFGVAELDLQSKLISDWLSSIEVESVLAFRLLNKSQGIVWEVLAEYRVLNELTDKLPLEAFDYLLWPEQRFTPPELMVFDMDSTFIQIEVIDELAHYHQVGEQVSSVTEAAMRGELDFSESLVSRVACLKGLAGSSIDDLAKKLPLSPGITELVESAKKHSCKIAIVSGGFMPFVEHLRQTMQLFKVNANQLEILDGELTGRVLGNIVDAQAKADFINQLCKELVISPSSVMAVGDGANDLKMMQVTGFNLAYYAKPKVRQAAKGKIDITQFDWLLSVFDWN